MSDLIDRARRFAIERHGDQMYGDQPYEDHLKEVAQTIEEHGGDEEQIAAGWLHDVEEDTDATREELQQEFGHGVEALVYAVTGIGETRAEKMANVRAKIAALPRAGLVKTADRERNVNACIRDRKEKLLRRYVNEQDELRTVLQEGALLELLDHKIEIAKGMLRIGLYRPNPKP